MDVALNCGRRLYFTGSYPSDRIADNKIGLILLINSFLVVVIRITSFIYVYHLIEWSPTPTLSFEFSSFIILMNLLKPNSVAMGPCSLLTSGGESKNAANSGKNQLKQKIVPLKPTRHFVYLFGDKVWYFTFRFGVDIARGWPAARRTVLRPIQLTTDKRNGQTRFKVNIAQVISVQVGHKLLSAEMTARTFSHVEMRLGLCLSYTRKGIKRRYQCFKFVTLVYQKNWQKI